MCAIEGELARPKYLNVLEWGMVVAVRHTGLSVNCNSTGFFTLKFSRIKNGPTPKGHPSSLRQLWEALESTWASFPVECFWHLVEFKPDKSRLFWGQKLNIRKLFLMFCTLSVCLHIRKGHANTPVFVNIKMYFLKVMLRSCSLGAFELWMMVYWKKGTNDSTSAATWLFSGFFSQPSFLVLLQ